MYHKGTKGTKRRRRVSTAENAEFAETSQKERKWDAPQRHKGHEEKTKSFNRRER
jgi:hypothetical protein